MTSGVESAGHGGRRVHLIFVGLSTAVLLAALDQTIVATALPAIAGELGGLRQLSWVVTSYLLAAATSVPLYGKLADVFGRKRVFQLVIAAFILAALACAFTRTLWQLVVFRGLQGLAGGGLVTLAQVIIADVVSPRERGRYVGYLGGVWMLASVGGPLVGGVIVDQLSWRWIFVVNVPFGLAALLLTERHLDADAHRGSHRPLDILGAVLLAGTVVTGLLMAVWGGTVHDWRSWPILRLALLSLVCAVAFVASQRRAVEPILPLELFRFRIFVDAMVIAIVVGILMFGAVIYLPLYLQIVGQTTATSSGLLLMPLMVGIVVANVASGLLVTRTGRYRIYPIVGSFLLVCGWGLLSSMTSSTNRGTVSLYMAIVGTGIGLSMQVVLIAVQNAVPRQHLGVATSSVQFFRQLGATVGVGAFGSIMVARARVELAGALEGTAISSLDDLLGGPQIIARLEPDVAALVRSAVEAGLESIFLLAILLAVVGFAFSLRLQELRLAGPEDMPTEP